MLVVRGAPNPDEEKSVQSEAIGERGRLLLDLDFKVCPEVIFHQEIVLSTLGRKGLSNGRANDE